MKKRTTLAAPRSTAKRGASAESEVDESQQHALKAVAALRAARKGVNLVGLKSRDLIAERRR